MTIPAVKPRVKLWLYRPQFGVKGAVYPPVPEALTYATHLGPNRTGQVRGLLKPPATVGGEFVAGVQLSLTAPDTSTTLNIGVTPYRRGAP